MEEARPPLERLSIRGEGEVGADRPYLEVGVDPACLEVGAPFQAEAEVHSFSSAP